MFDNRILKLTKVCPICKKEYKTRRDSQKYCSLLCFSNAPKKGIVKNCLMCGKEMHIFPYQVKTGNGKYCSQKCSAQAQSKKVRIQCKMCFSYYYVSPSVAKQMIYCSRQCYAKARKAGLYTPWNKGLKTFDEKAYAKQYGIKHRGKNREIVFKHYGQRCACCGETTYEFLTIDHINGDGCKHRREIKGDVYRWLIKNNYPEGFQVLCYNCNCSKGFYGICPHKKEVQNGQ